MHREIAVEGEDGFGCVLVEAGRRLLAESEERLADQENASHDQLLKRQIQATDPLAELSVQEDEVEGAG